MLMLDSLCAAQPQAIKAGGGWVRIKNNAALTRQTFTIATRFRATGNGSGGTGDAFGGAIAVMPREGAVGNAIQSWYLGWSATTRKVIFSLTHVFGGQSTTLSSKREVLMGEAAHIAVTFDGATVRLYINGVPDSSVAALRSAVYYGNEDVLLGAGNYGAGFVRRLDGEISQFVMYERVLSPQEVELIAPCDTVLPGLAAAYMFDNNDSRDELRVGPAAMLENGAEFVDLVRLEPGSVAGCIGEPLTVTATVNPLLQFDVGSLAWSNNGQPIGCSDCNDLTLSLAPSIAQQAGRLGLRGKLCGIAFDLAADTSFSFCPADFTCDGFLTFDDFDAFVNDFERGSARADISGDGFIEFVDLDVFVGSFEAGC